MSDGIGGAALLGVALILAGGACSDGDVATIEAVSGTQASFQLDVALDGPDTFYDFPYPSDLRLTAEGTPDARHMPIPAGNALIRSLRDLVPQRRGFSAVSAAYFRFSGPIDAQTEETIYPAKADSPVLLIEVDAVSAAPARLYPLIAHTPRKDAYLPEHTLALAPMPGVVLPAGRRFAYVVLRELADAEGEPLGSSLAFEQLKKGQLPQGERGQAALDLYRPLWGVLERAGVDLDRVAAATIFTTGDLPADLAALSDQALSAHEVTITDLQLAAVGDHPRFCQLTGKMVMPQFLAGTPPYNSEGSLAFEADGTLKKTREQTLPVTITLPKTAMPAEGFPLGVYVHGSGGLSVEVVQRGKIVPPSTTPTPGEGPAHVLAPFGVAMASTAKPVNPERLPGASPYAYINPQNLPATRDLFRQGVIEERLFVRALERLQIPAAALGGCEIPGNASSYQLDLRRLFYMGQSMGGMFSNLVAAVEPKVKAVVPTGAGGMWGYVLLKSEMLLISMARSVMRAVDMSVAHPAFQIVQSAWEPADPIVFVPRIARRPLPGHPARHVYQPAGFGDSYFPTAVYDAVAVAYGHQQAGEQIWPSMQESLAEVGLDGLASYPVTLNRMSADGETPVTAAIVQKKDGLNDGHYVAFQLDEVKFQYGCFVSSLIRAGAPTIPAPAALGAPCPTL